MKKLNSYKRVHYHFNANSKKILIERKNISFMVTLKFQKKNGF